MISAVLILASCGRDNSEAPLLLWSNEPDAAFFVERYNYLSDDSVEFEYVENIVEAITQRRDIADVVVGSWVNTPVVSDRMAVLEEDDRWIPLAFALPTIAYPAGGALSGRERVTLSEIGELTYADTPPDQIANLAFLPSYGRETSWVLLRSLGLSIAGDATGDPILETDRLSQHLSTLRDWQNQYHGSIAREHNYRDRYLYEPWNQLLEKNRLEALYISSEELLDWEFFARSRWEFSYLTDGEGGLFALDGVVYAGIPAGSDQIQRSRNLIRWLRDPEVQIALIEQKLIQRIDSFGLFGGFSMAQEVNDQILMELYPHLDDRRFLVSEVRLPEQRPRYWNEALDQVVFPFLVTPESGDLTAELRRWYRQRGD